MYSHALLETFSAKMTIVCVVRLFPIHYSMIFTKVNVSGTLCFKKCSCLEHRNVFLTFTKTNGICLFHSTCISCKPLHAGLVRKCMVFLHSLQKKSQCSMKKLLNLFCLWVTFTKANCYWLWGTETVFASSTFTHLCFLLPIAVPGLYGLHVNNSR